MIDAAVIATKINTRNMAFNQHLCHQGQSSAVTVREGNHDK